MSLKSRTLPCLTQPVISLHPPRWSLDLLRLGRQSALRAVIDGDNSCLLMAPSPVFSRTLDGPVTSLSPGQSSEAQTDGFHKLKIKHQFSTWSKSLFLNEALKQIFVFNLASSDSISPASSVLSDIYFAVCHRVILSKEKKSLCVKFFHPP